MAAGGPAQLRSRPTGPYPCPSPSLSPSPSPPAAARPAAAASVEEPETPPRRLRAAPEPSPCRATGAGAARPPTTAVQPPRAASPSSRLRPRRRRRAAEGARGASLSPTSCAPAAIERAYLDGTTTGDGCSNSGAVEIFSSLPAWIPSNLENFGGLRVAFIWPPFLQAVGIDHRV